MDVETGKWEMGKRMEETLPPFFIFLYPLSVHPSV